MSNITKLFKKYGANKFANETNLVYADILPDKVDALLEIGIGEGGSLNAWCEFYPDAHIFGIDISRLYVHKYKGRANVYLCDVSDRKTMLEIVRCIPSLDIIIDDGSHNAKNQQDAFDVMFSKLKPNGVYVIEDLHVANDPNRQSNGYPSTIDFLAALPHNVEFHREYTATIRGIIS